MVLGMVREARALLEHLRERYPKVAVAGYSMGGHMAAITAAVSPFPLACAALAAGASASSVYTGGLLSWSVDFTGLGGGAIQRAAARERLRQLFTVADVNCFPPPVRCDAAIIAGCQRDGYVLRSETETPSPALAGQHHALDPRRTLFRPIEQPPRAAQLHRQCGREVVNSNRRTLY
jgi:hypothetical protein